MLDHRYSMPIVLLAAVLGGAVARAEAPIIPDYEISIGATYHHFDDQANEIGMAVGGYKRVGELLDGLYVYPGFLYRRVEVELHRSPLCDDFPDFPDCQRRTRTYDGLALGAELRYYPKREPVGVYLGLGWFGAYVFEPSDETALIQSGVFGYAWNRWLVETRYMEGGILGETVLLFGRRF